MIGVLFFFGYKVFGMSNRFKSGIFVSLIIFSHLVADYFALDYSYPEGIQFFWPVRTNFYSSSVAIFRDVSKASSSSKFIGSLFCWHNLFTILIEMAITGPLFVLSWIWYKSRK
jgi:hypothetical protein